MANTKRTQIGGPDDETSGRRTMNERRARGPRATLALAGGSGAVFAMIALLLLPLGGAHGGAVTAGALPAAPHGYRSVDANFTGNITFTGVSIVNNVTYLTATTDRVLTGNMSGTLLAYEWGAVQPNGSMWVRGIGTFVGTILGGLPGLVHLTWFATGTYGGSLSGVVHLFHGMKGLAGVHGSGSASASFTGPASFDGSYDLSLVVP
ncbi:MAG: hypothetical protein L3J91_06375 [Thermoplasmata archaeon]|nr:hypothetical protein [Thermoplasmata archaeon]